MVEVVGVDERLKRWVTCKECASILLYTPSETRERRASYMGDVCTETVLDCPQCKRVIILRSN